MKRNTTSLIATAIIVPVLMVIAVVCAHSSRLHATTADDDAAYDYNTQNMYVFSVLGRKNTGAVLYTDTLGLMVTTKKCRWDTDQHMISWVYLSKGRQLHI